MLSIVGLGLQDGDISQNGRDAIADADTAYAELYTNTIEYDLEQLEEETGTEIATLGREQVEDEDLLVEEAAERDVAFLVSGDPLAATTHQDIMFRARERGIETEVVHAPSVFTVVAATGLSLYKFGRTTTLTLQNGEVPPSVLDTVEENGERGLHTLVLVDPDDGVEALEAGGIADWEVLLCSGLGTDSADIRYGVAGTLDTDVAEPVSVVVPGDLSRNEEERLESIKKQ